MENEEEDLSERDWESERDEDGRYPWGDMNPIPPDERQTTEEIIQDLQEKDIAQECEEKQDIPSIPMKIYTEKI